MLNVTPKAVTKKTESARKKIEEITRLPIKTSALLTLIILVVFGLLATLIVSLASPGCSQSYRDDEDLTVNGQEIQIEIAKTNSELTKGLSGKKCISEYQGMLFPFARPANYSFWMRDMTFPIDIVWINPEHKVVQIDSNVSPKSYPKVFNSAVPAQYVLELKAGEARNLGLTRGSQINI